MSHILSKNMKAFRALQKKSQQQFAQELGISKSTLHEIEHDKNPHLDTLICISERLGVPLIALLSDDPPPTQMGILVHLINAYDWFARCSDEEQQQILAALQQVSQTLAIIKDRGGDLHELS